MTGGDPELEREASYAAELLVRSYREKGDADDEPWAAAFIALLRARGWRPTLARAGPDWRRAGGGEPGRMSAADRARVLGDAAAAAEAIRAAGAARAAGKAGDGGDDP